MSVRVPSTILPEPEPVSEGLLDGQVLLVTGGGRGIGAAIALAGADAGARVVVVGRTEPTGIRDHIVQRGAEAISVAGDVANSADAERIVAAAVTRFGGVDVVVNNAAVLETAPLLDTDVDSFDRVMTTNVRGVFLMTQAAGRRMAAQQSGVVINIGSDLAVRGRAHYAAYAASKGAVLQLTRTAAIELGAHGVRVVMLSPAATNTEMARPALADPQTRADLLSKGTLDRINEPEDVAAAAIFLASPAARTVTGCNWPIDAGVLAR